MAHDQSKMSKDAAEGRNLPQTTSADSKSGEPKLGDPNLSNSKKGRKDSDRAAGTGAREASGKAKATGTSEKIPPALDPIPAKSAKDSPPPPGSTPPTLSSEPFNLSSFGEARSPLSFLAPEAGGPPPLPGMPTGGPRTAGSGPLPLPPALPGNRSGTAPKSTSPPPALPPATPLASATGAEFPNIAKSAKPAMGGKAASVSDAPPAAMAPAAPPSWPSRGVSGASGPTLAFAAAVAPAPEPANDPVHEPDSLDVGDDVAGDALGGEAPDRRVARRRPAGPVRGKVAANDDAPSIGGLIYALEQKPSNKIYRHAAIASAVWTVAGLIFAILSLSSEAALSSWGTILAKPTTFLTATAIVVPVAVIWLLALLSWRAEELRLRSSTMTEVAIRLAEPDRMAEDSVASLGQAVRRQVGFMNEAVGRALGRAGELEALVHNEVAALERSYEENERRIRGLINELANERHALTSTSVSFNETLRTLGREVPTLIEKLSNQQSNLSHIIHGAGENLNQLESTIAKSVLSLESELGGRTNELQGVLENYTGALGQALNQRTEQLGTMLGSHGQRLQSMMDDRSKLLGDSIGNRSEDIQKMLEAYTGGLAQALTQRTSQMQSSFAEHMTLLDKAIANRTTNLQTVFEEYARALDGTLAARAGTLDKQLVERTRALDSAFEGRLRLFDDAIQNSTRAIDVAVDTRAKALTSALENHARTFSDTISRQSLELDESLNQGITAVRRTSENITRQSLKAIESLAGQSDMLKSVSENLVSQIGSLTNRFEAQGHTIMKAANALESVNYKIDSTLQSRHAELSATLDRMVGKADEFTRHVHDYSTTIEGTLSEAEARALAAAEQLKIGTQSHREQAFTQIERLKAETDAESARALDALKERLSHVSEEVSSHLGSLTDRFSETSEDVRKRAERVADELAREQARMKEEADRLPQTTRESAEAMRQALQDQLRAIDQLSSLANREAQRRDVGLPVAQGGALKPADGPVAPPTRPGAGSEASHASHASPASHGARNLTSLTESLTQELGARGGQSITPNQRPNPARGGDVRGPADNAASSWSLGDLLKRASNNEVGATEQQQPAAVQPPLPASQHIAAPSAAPSPAAAGRSISTEPFKLNIDVLARALDGATAAAIWQRLRAGQRGIMVRSIYSTDGRQVFDEVARRYPVDPNLQATINRYIGDFERILRDTETRDTSGRLAQTHMTSTMGRVYLLLAHAAGRIS